MKIRLATLCAIILILWAGFWVLGHAFIVIPFLPVFGVLTLALIVLFALFIHRRKS